MPDQAALFHCDKHVTSQIRESCQMLSTCHRMIDGSPGEVIFQRKDGPRVEVRPILRHLGEKDGMLSEEAVVYWDCYHNHPCNKWVRESRQNYGFLVRLAACLNEQFRARYGNKDHGSWVKNSTVLGQPPLGLNGNYLTDFAQAMPEPYRDTHAMRAYRRYYRLAKGHLYHRLDAEGHKWPGYSKGVDVPFWLIENPPPIYAHEPD